MTRRIVLVALFFVIVSLLASGIALAADFAWPVEGKVLRPFEKDVHRGIDIEATEGTKVKAAVSGTVTYVGYSEGSSSNLFHTVSIEYGNEGYHTTYLQIKPLVAKGQSVAQGQEIGEVVKSTDKHTSVSHLHFGVYQRTERGEDPSHKDPLSFLPGLISESAQELAQEPAAASQLVSDGAEAQPILTDQPSPVSAGTTVDVTRTPSVQSPDTPVIAQPPPQAEQVSPSETIPVTQSHSQGVSPTTSLESVKPVAAPRELAQSAPTVSLPPETKVIITYPDEPGKAVAAASSVAQPSLIVSPVPVPGIEVVIDPPASSAASKSINFFKDRQIEMLSSTPANSQKSSRPLDEQQRILRERRVQSEETVAINTDPAVITRLFLYLLLVISFLVSTRAYKLRPGPTARA
jgi:hypothetical protein